MIRGSTSGGEYVRRGVVVVMLMNEGQSLGVEGGGNDLPVAAKVLSEYRVEGLGDLVLDKLEILGDCRCEE